MPNEVTFSARVYSLETIKKAAYRLSGVMSVDIVPQGDDFRCTLHLAEAQPEQNLAEIVASFRSEVLDQDLRAVVAAETAPIRNAVLAYAFSKTGLQGTE
jgi:His-Xaa-Ser system protein HxsD